MASSPAFTFTLYSVGFVWLLLLIGVAVDRYLHERGVRRMMAARGALLQSQGADAAVLRDITGRLTIAELDKMLGDGLPSGLQIALARAMTDRHADLARVASAGGNVWKRIAAARVVAASASQARYRLLDRMLRSGTPTLAAAAVRMLAQINDRHAADILVKALRAGVYSRSRIAAAFDVMSVSRGDLLKTLFEAEEPQVRFWAAKLAGRLQARQWNVRVRQLTTDADALVRRAAVEALGITGSPDDYLVLEARMNDPVPFVRAHAARACARFSDRRSVEAPAHAG